MNYEKKYLKYKKKYLCLRNSRNYVLKNIIHGGNFDKTQLKIHIFLLCLNEEILLPKTINHYKKIFPHCEITICDNGSTDNSINIAKNNGCSIHQWKVDNSNHLMIKATELRNNVWKTSNADWIIVCDMDEFLCMTEKELENENRNGITMISTIGYEIVGDSKTENLIDLDITNISFGFQSHFFNKSVCFKKNSIKEINYDPGCHLAYPIGDIKRSEKQYPLYHFNFLGLPWITKKYIMRKQQSIDIIKHGQATHYTGNISEITKKYDTVKKNSVRIRPLSEYYLL